MKKKRMSFCLLGLCSLLLLSGCGKVPKLQNGKEVVASINGYEITAEDLFEILKKNSGTSAMVSLIDEFIVNKEIETDETIEEYAKGQIEAAKAQAKAQGNDFNSLLLQAGYANEKEFKEAIITNYKSNKTVQKYLEEHLTEKEIEEYYNENVFGEITARHILIKPDVETGATSEEKTKAEEEAKKKAEEVIKKLKDGAKWEDLVKEYSEDEGTKSNNGQLTFTKNQVVAEFWKASAALKDNTYTTTPVKSEYGYHVIYRVSQATRPTLEDSKDDVKEELANKKLENDTSLAAKTWAEIRKDYKLTINDDHIKNVYDSTIKSYK